VRRLAAAAVLLVAFPALAASGRHDVNRDGRFDQDDVQALARMVAGLEPADLECDQNGDGLLTVADVESLQAALEAGETGPASQPGAQGTATDTAGAAAVGAADHTAPSGVPFLVVREAKSGNVVVAVGGEGVKVGDRILGVFHTLDEAEAARQAFLAGGSPPAPAGTGHSTSPPPPVQASGSAIPPDSAEAAPSVAELRGAVAAVPLGSGRALFVAPDWREGWLLNPIGDGSRANLVHQDLGAMSRWQGQFGRAAAVYHAPRRADSLLIYLPRRGDGRIFRGLWRRKLSEGRIAFSRALQGRIGPRSVLPLLRQANNGKSTGLYLYHWPSGTALYSPTLSSNLHDIEPRAVSGFPAMAHEPLALPVESREGATRSFVLIEPQLGNVWLVLDVRPHPFHPQPVAAGVDLGTLRQPGSSGLSLAAAPLYGADGASRAALVADSVSGRMAVLEDDDDPSRIRLRPLDTTLDGLVPGGPQRRLMALPLGRRGGVLVLDAASGRLVRIVPGGGATALVRPVTILR